jgi:hypothetical protein
MKQKFQKIHANQEYTMLSLTNLWSHHVITTLEQWYSMIKVVSSSQTSITNSGAEFINALFNIHACKALYTFIVYKPPQMQTNYFSSILETILEKIHSNSPIIMIKYFNINSLTNTFQLTTTLQNYMNKQSSKVQPLIMQK